MVAFIASILFTAAMLAVVVLVAKRRTPGTPLTWGEAFVAATWVFTLFFMCYGIVPDQFLRWADGDLAWRQDTIGIPLGPLGGPLNAILPDSWVVNNLLAPEGIALPKGRFIITAQVIRDAVASVIYVVFGLLHIFMWLWWQKRGTKSTTPELETSTYGRPLLRKV